MHFFGLVWVTSWVSYFLASSQGLFKVPEYLSSDFPARIFSVVNSPIEIPTPLFPTPLYTGIWSSNSSVATFPNLAFQMGAGSFQFRPQPTQTSVRPPVRVDLPKNTFCRLEPEPEDNFLPVATPSSLSASWEETSSHEASKASFPQKLLQMVQNLLPWRQRSEPVKSIASSVVVISSHSSEPVGEKQHTEVKRVKRGFWRYSQLLSSRAFAAPSKPEPERFQVWVKERLIAQLPKQEQAELMALRLKQFLSNPSDPYLNTSPIQPALFEGQPAVKVGDGLLFKVDETLAADLDCNPELLAIEWVNNLRTALGKEPLKLAQAQKRMHNLVETPRKFEGQASWYGDQFHGRLTATGETYNQHELTAAHPSLPFNTYLKVRNLDNGNAVIVRVNDRGPYVPNRVLDLSREAARCIDGEKAGVVPIEAVVMQPPSERKEYWVKN
jgi:rare lipoprotein A